MSLFALGLVLGSAFLHAGWNLLAKRVAGGVEFVWLFAAVSLACFAPAVAVYVWLARPEFTATHALLAVASSLLHVAYMVLLQRGYRVGDLSLVYPLARGSGPALATLLAVLVLGEQPGAQALLGTLLVVGSVLVLTTGRSADRRNRNLAVLYGLATGMVIGLYTIWDGYAVGHAGATPLLYLVAAEAGRVLLLTPLAIKGRIEVRRLWREHRGATIGIAVLSPLAYLMILSALEFTPVSIVAPTREISILIGTILGWRLLSEGDVRRRLVGAAGMVAGVALLALA